MSTMKKVNKYNVRAIRKELDSCVRAYAWKRFREVLNDVAPANNTNDDGAAAETDGADTSLLVAIVMERTKSVRGTPSSHPTLLHAVVDKINSGSCASKSSGYGRRAANQIPPPYDIIDAIAYSVPQALLVQDGRNGRTPLHLAISRNACPAIIESLIRNDRTKRSLQLEDRRNDTPITCYIRASDSLEFNDDGSIGHLLLLDGKAEKMLAYRAGPKRKAPVFYAAAKELREAGLLKSSVWATREGGAIPDTLRFIMVRTYNVLIFNLRERCFFEKDSSLERNLPTFDVESTADIPLLHTFASAISCSLFFDDLSITIFSLLREEIKREVEVIRGGTGKTGIDLVDERGNSPLHLLALPALHYRLDGPLGLPRCSTRTETGFLHKSLIEHCPEWGRLPNHDQNLPLHLACSLNSFLLLKDLCDTFPAGTAHRNAKGELPLHVFLKRIGTRVPLDWDRSESRLALEQLLRAGPDTVAMRDGPTGLYPFQLASIHVDEARHFDLAFKLLKMQPDLCASALEDAVE